MHVTQSVQYIFQIYFQGCSKICEITSGFEEISGLKNFFVGNNLKKGKKLAKFVYGLVETVEFGELVLKETCLSQINSAVQYNIELQVSDWHTAISILLPYALRVYRVLAFLEHSLGPFSVFVA